MRNQRYSRYLNSRSKTFFDVVACVLLLPPALVIVAVAGLSILILDGRPVFFVHLRAGKDGELFRMPKLRTLRVDANPYEPATESDEAGLVSVTGRYLRHHKLDELPQLLSVLTGKMSLIGPRPELPQIAAKYTSLQRKRLLCKPGVTGLWQTMGNHKIAMHKGIKYDIYYLCKASLWLDVKILAMTVRLVLNPKWKGP